MKKKNLYKLVKQSLKEVLQEQRINPRILDRLRLNPSTGRPYRPGDPLVNPQTGETLILKPDDIDADSGIPKALIGVPTGKETGLFIVDICKSPPRNILELSLIPSSILFFRIVTDEKINKLIKIVKKTFEIFDLFFFNSLIKN